MLWSCVLLVVVAICHVNADIYCHSPRCCNNRLDGDRRERRNNNRLCDTQNNARAGYNVGGPANRDELLTECYAEAKTKTGKGIRAEWEETCGPPGKMKYYEGSILDVTWTNQHECGGDNSHCEIILQYMCSDNLRDGIIRNTIPDNINNCDIGEDNATRSCDEDRRFGMHENLEYYATCKNTLRNVGLFRADRNLRGNSAKYTRQNNNGARSGLECPEERDYYPYWRPTPWIDIAIMTNNVSRCAEYKNQSENVAPRYYCKVPAKLIEKLIQENKEGHGIPITEDECKKFKFEDEAAQWVKDDRTLHSEPDCLPSPKNRDNHHGNKPDGFFNSYNWTIPNNPNKHCALRLRYNISTQETPFSKDHERIVTPALASAYKANLRCMTEEGDNECCTEATPCGIGEGDCESSNDCATGLICGNANSVWSERADVCRPDVLQERSASVNLIGATSSSVYNDDTDNYGPQLAFSGRSDSNQGFFHSKRETDPWVTMQIASTLVSSITIINRRGHGQRLQNVKVRAGTSSELPGTTQNPEVGTFDGPGENRGEYLIAFNSPVQTEYITIQIIGTRQILQINGIRVNELNAKFQEVGCFKDQRRPRAIGGGYTWFDKAVVIQRCANKAALEGHEIFAVQYDVECFTDGISSEANANVTYARYGAGDECRDGRGGDFRNSVYKIVPDAGNPTVAYSDAYPEPPRCRGEDSFCCTADLPCDFGEGDCDTHADCKGGLICGIDNCAAGRFQDRDDCCKVNEIAALIGADEVEAKERGFVFANNPKVRPLILFDGEEDIGKLLELDLAMNTAQYGRTFQDRTHEFSILERPDDLKDVKIHNVNVRGKRGNIVQVYPATEYDYTPNRLEVPKGEYAHIQWTGSDRNPRGNDGNGRRGTDRNNVLLLGEQVYTEGTSGAAVPLDVKHGHWGRSYPANLKNDEEKTFLGLSRADRQALALSDTAYPLLSESELLSSKDAKNAVSASNQMLTLECGSGEVIRITSAYYGTLCELNSVCSTCTGINSMKRLKATCDGKTSCVTRVSRGSFGLNCETNEAMHVSYKCLKASVNYPTLVETQSYRCNGQDNGCCTDETPCDLNHGDCDRDSHCKGNMTCGTDNCVWGDRDDCCLNLPAYRCNGQDDGCCTDETPCDLNHGDCDRDSHCKGDLVCGIDNCVWGDHDDCCTPETYLDLNAASHYFNLGARKLDKEGEFKYMCSRNNDFSNRSQKGKIKVIVENKKKDSPTKDIDAKLENKFDELVDELNELDKTFEK